MSNNIHIAESGFQDFNLPDQFIAGDTPQVVTRDELVTNAGAWPQYTPLQRNNSTQKLELWAAGNEVAAITAYDVAIGTNVRSAYYFAGMFNIDMIKWPNGTTEAQAEAGLRGMVQARKLLYSNKRTGNEQLGVPAGPSLLKLTPASGALPNSVEDVAMSSVQLAALNNDGAVTYSLYSGAVPAGTSVNSAGLYAGTPTTVGDYTFAVKGVDANGKKIGVVHYTHKIVAA